MFNLAICDDDINFGDKLQDMLLEAYPHELTMQCYNNGAALWHDISNQLSTFDLLLMDIRMPHLDGIATSVKIRERDKTVPIILMTGYPEYALSGYKVQPYEFLVKPLRKEQLLPVMDGVLALIRQYRTKESLLVQTRQQSYCLPLCDIVYMESHGRKLVVYTASAEHSLYGRISDYAKQLRDEGFVLIHRCVLANLRYVERIDCVNRLAILSGGVRLGISAERLGIFKTAFHERFRAALHG